jgi:hypothetical protein
MIVKPVLVTVDPAKTPNINSCATAGIVVFNVAAQKPADKAATLAAILFMTARNQRYGRTYLGRDTSHQKQH